MFFQQKICPTDSIKYIIFEVKIFEAVPIELYCWPLWLRMRLVLKIETRGTQLFVSNAKIAFFLVFLCTLERKYV